MTVLAVFIGCFGLDCYGINISDDPSRCSCRTKPDCHPYRSSRAVYRFGRSGSSGVVGHFLEDFGFNQLVMQVVEIVLHFVVGQFAVDQVAEVVVVIGCSVVGFQAVVRDGRAIVVGQDIVRGVEVACTFSGNPKRLRSFEQKPRACVPHAPYVGIGGFMRATACLIHPTFTQGFIR